MAVESLVGYNRMFAMQNRTLAIYGQPATVFVPDQWRSLGYEDMTPAESDSTGVDYLGTTWKKQRTTCWIEFHVKKSVLYHFNYFPDGQEELTSALFRTGSQIRDGCFVRTSVPGQVSIWGDVLFHVVKIFDEGLFKTLKRTVFMRPYAGKELYDLFSREMAEAGGWL